MPLGVGNVTAKETRSHKRDFRFAIGKRLSDEPFWPVKRVLAWIVFRHEAGLKASLNAGSEIVARVTWLQRDVDQGRTLLRALQEGSVAALKDGKELAREFWAGARVDDDDWPRVHFRRENVLTLWPKLPPKKSESLRSTSARNSRDRLALQTRVLESKEIVPTLNKPGPRSVKMDAAVDAMRAAVELGTISAPELAQMPQKSLSNLYKNAGRTVLAEARRRALTEIAKQGRQNADVLSTNPDIRPTNDK
jgi:hypothetical protein